MKRLGALGSLAALALLAALTGCHSVYTKDVIGAQLARLEKDQLNGTWTWDGGAVAVKVTDQERGQMALAWINDDNDTFTLKMTTACLRKQNDLLLLSVRNPDYAKKPETGPYAWLGAMNMNGNRGLLCLPDWEKIGALVKADKLPGKVVNDGDVSLGKLTRRHLDMLTTVGMLAWDKPVIFTKVNK